MPTELRDPTGTLVATVLPLTSEARGQLAKETIRQATELVTLAGDTLRGVAGSTAEMAPARLTACTTTTQLTERTFGTSTPTLRQHLTALLTANVARVEALGETYAQLQHAVAEAEMSRSTSLNVATRLAWLDPVMSRVAGVRVLTGAFGGTGMHGYPADGPGPCPVEAPTEPTRHAIAVLRAGGMAPSIVTNFDVPLRSLLLGGDEVSPYKSLRARVSSLSSDASFWSVSDETSFAATLGTTPRALEDARRYLAHEHLAFARDDRQQIAGGVPLSPQYGYPRTVNEMYAGMLNEPTGVPTAFSIARVRFADSSLVSKDVDQRLTSGSLAGLPRETNYPGLIPVRSDGLASVTSVVDYAMSLASDLGTLDVPSGAWRALPSDVRGDLGRFLTGMGGRRPHRLQICSIGTGRAQRDEVRLEAIATNTASGRLRIVRGVAGLRCATEGNIEGESCTVFDDDSNTDDVDVSDQSTKFSVRPPATERWFGAAHAEGVRTTPLRFDPTGEGGPEDFVFVVLPRDGVRNPGPGDFVALGGVRLISPTNANSPSLYDHCTILPVMPEFDDQVDDLVEMDTTTCSFSITSCAGMLEGDTIPLENELTSDGDGVEDSWRHYLNLAATAALHADTLGESLVSAGFEIDEEAELAEDAVRTLCGQSVNVGDVFFDMLDEPPRGRCSCATPECDACGDGYICDSGMCRRDIDAFIRERAALHEPGYRELAECLSSSGTVPYTTPGSHPVCAWRLPSDDQLCGDLPGGRAVECPWLASAEAAALPNGQLVIDPSRYCVLPDGVPSGTELVLVNHRLDIFEPEQIPDDGQSEEEDSSFACSSLREYRMEADPARRLELAAEIVKAFDVQTVRANAARTTWRGFPDDYSAVLLDGATWRSTGRPDASEPIITEWPCAPGPAECRGETDPGSASGLFCGNIEGLCGVVGGDDRVLRAAMNHRLLRAVLTLRMITGLDFVNIEIPFVPELQALTLEADAEHDQEFARVKWSFDNGLAMPVRSGRTVSASDRVDYVIWEKDLARDDRGTYQRDGAVYCEEGGNGHLWTHIGHNAWLADGGLNLVQGRYEGDVYQVGTYQPIFSRCGSMGSSQPNRRLATMPLTFAMVSGDGVGRAQGISDEAWQGMGSPISLSDLQDMADEHFGDDRRERLGSERWLVRMLAGSPNTQGPWLSSSNDESVVSCTIRNGGSGRQRWRCAPALTFTDYFFADEYNRVSPFRDSVGPEPANGTLPGGIPGRLAVLDALELACEIAADDLSGENDALGRSNCDGWDADANINVSNLREAQRLMQCMAEDVRSRGTRAIIEGMPSDAVESLVQGRSFEGDRGQAVAQVAADVLEIAQFPHRMATELDDASLLLRQARNAIDRNEVQLDLIELEKMSTKLRETTGCISATMSAAANAGESWMGSFHVASAMATCANSIGQIVIATQQAALQSELTRIDTDTTLTSITREMSRTLNSMSELAASFRQADIRLRAAVDALKSRRAQVMSQVEEVLVTYGNPSAPANVRRRRFNTARIRYAEAHQRAVKTAWMARRALEQRLGVSLRDLDDSLHLVESPSSWADRLCTMRGFDYGEISRGYTLDGQDDFAEEYVGDYVRRLEDVFESYSVDFPFVDGEDVAVVSMKEDVVRAPLEQCRVATHNLLAYSGSLDVREDPEVLGTIEPGDRASFEVPLIWARWGCDEVALADGDGDVSSHVGGCVVTSRRDENIGDWAPGANESVTRVTFGGTGTGPNGELIRTWTSGARLAQRVELPPGRYRVSWYGYDPATPATQRVNPGSVVAPLHPDGTALSAIQSETFAQYLQDGWARYYRFFELARTSVVDIAVSSPTPTSLVDGQPSLPMEVDLAGLMLEDVSSVVPSLSAAPDGYAYPPRAYVTTVGRGEGYLTACEDASGALFRNEWHYGCERVCPSGADTCSGGRRGCFWERTFEISLEHLESNTRFRRSGFAIGNYNYRWTSLGVNLVGTGIRDCQSTDSPSTCYGAGYVPFSVHHGASEDGGYPVRNHQGDVYLAPLFPGRIQHARSLAAERYLTNPLSGSDRGLVEPYLRSELRGRPLTGRYAVRIWDDGGLDWSRVEDIQLVLGYRYWTRTR